MLLKHFPFSFWSNTMIRTTSVVVMLALFGLVLPIDARCRHKQRPGFLQKATGWISSQINKVEQAADEVGGHIERAAKKVTDKIRGAKEHVQREVAQHVEKHVQPIVARTEKRIHRNTGKLLAKYCAAGLGGIASICLLRQVATRMTRGSETGFGGWLQKEDKSATLAADALIGALIGAGLYGLYEAQSE